MGVPEGFILSAEILQERSRRKTSMQNAKHSSWYEYCIVTVTERH